MDGTGETQRILVTGARGQIGTELVDALRERYPEAFVLATDLQVPEATNGHARAGGSLRYERLDVTDADAIHRLLDTHRIDTVFHLASLLSATGEQHPDRAWRVNLNGLRYMLEAARQRALRLFWPSSIAVFGPTTPKHAPQATVLEPTTMYGITKVSGELLCRYYHRRYDVDVRSLRYPGLISYRTPPGGGTTDYAVEIFYAAVRGEAYQCFVEPETRLPMMYMPDAIRASLELMEADGANLTVPTSYNVGALSFQAQELAAAIERRVDGFRCTYAPDARQRIAETWPEAVDDEAARQDWDWQPAYDLEALVDDMLTHLEKRQEVPSPADSQQ